MTKATFNSAHLAVSTTDLNMVPVPRVPLFWVILLDSFSLQCLRNVGFEITGRDNPTTETLSA